MALKRFVLVRNAFGCMRYRNFASEAPITQENDEAKTNAYMKEIAEARARIFGHTIGNGLRSGNKILRKPLVGERVAKWYPTPMRKLDPLFHHPKEERRVERVERLKRAGKGRKKKEESKAASKKKKK